MTQDENTPLLPKTEDLDLQYHQQLAEFSRKDFERHNNPFLAFLAGMLVLELEKLRGK